MKAFKFSPIILFTIVLLVSCKNKKEEVTDKPEDNYGYVPLKEFTREEAIIKPGTEVEILAALGGPANNGDTVYYYQFIVIDKASGDTVRILSPQITVQLPDADNNRQIPTTPTIYNIEMGITTAYYELIDVSNNLLLNGENLDKLANSPTPPDLNKLMDPANAKEFVVVDKETPESSKRFKTAIGILNFKQRPW